jgi:phosphate-selective porin OprO/OprP
MPAATRPRSAALAASAAVSALAWTAAGAALAQAQAQALAPPAPQALQAEVEELKALIQAQARQINGLSAQVQDLKTQLEAQTPVTTGGRQAPPPTEPAPQAATTQGTLKLPQPEQAEPRVAENSRHRLQLVSPLGYSIGPAGEIQIDAGAYTSFRPANAFVGPQALSNGVNARRARFGFVGTTPGDFSFAFQYDAGNSQDTTPRGIETAQLVYRGLKGAVLEAGYSDTFFTLDQATSSSDLLFLERSSATVIATDFNAGDFRSNLGARVFGDRYWIGAYLTGPASSSDSHTQTAERFGAFERVAVQALQGEDYSLHLGADVDQLIQAPNSGHGTPNTLVLSDQPELRIDPTPLLNTGTIGSAAHPVAGGVVYDLETAANWENLFWQGEYFHYQVERLGLPNNDFDGWYGQVAWTVSGETRTYNPHWGSYFRIHPDYPFDRAAGQWGAWELAARFDYVNLISRFSPGEEVSPGTSAINGGAQHGLTLGLNWYPNDLIRFLLDYIHISFDKENGMTAAGAPLGVPVGAHFDAVALRTQVVY